MLRKPTKIYTTEDIKYNIGRKAVAELASHNSLEKVSRKELGEKYLWPLHQCTSTGNIQIELEISYNEKNKFS